MNEKKHRKFSLGERLKSFCYAFNGLKILWKEEHNARIHLIIAFLVVIAGFIFRISVTEWLAVLLSIGFVLALEIFNSSIENLADFVSPEKHEKIKKIKDLSAAGVLIAAITAFVVGLIIFLPKIFSLFKIWFRDTGCRILDALWLKTDHIHQMNWSQPVE